MAMHIMTPCAPMEGHGQAVKTGDSQEALKSGLVHIEACHGQTTRKGRPVNRLSLEIRNTPGVQAARTGGPRRIWGQQTEQDNSPRQGGHHMEDTQNEEWPRAGEWSKPRRQPPQRMEQRASRTRKRLSNTRQDPSAFRTEKHKDTSEKRE